MARINVGLFDFWIILQIKTATCQTADASRALRFLRRSACILKSNDLIHTGAEQIRWWTAPAWLTSLATHVFRIRRERNAAAETLFFAHSREIRGNSPDATSPFYYTNSVSQTGLFLFSGAKVDKKIIYFNAIESQWITSIDFFIRVCVGKIARSWFSPRVGKQSRIFTLIFCRL